MIIRRPPSLPIIACIAIQYRFLLRLPVHNKNLTIALFRQLFWTRRVLIREGIEHQSSCRNWNTNNKNRERNEGTTRKAPVMRGAILILCFKKHNGISIKRAKKDFLFLSNQPFWKKFGLPILTATSYYHIRTHLSPKLI